MLMPAAYSCFRRVSGHDALAQLYFREVGFIITDMSLTYPAPHLVSLHLNFMHHDYLFKSLFITSEIICTLSSRRSIITTRIICRVKRRRLKTITETKIISLLTLTGLEIQGRISS